MAYIPDHIQQLIHKFFEGSITPEEKKRLDEWYHSFSSDNVVVFSDESEKHFNIRMKSRLNKLLEKNRAAPTARIIFFRAAAAAVFIIAASLLIFKFVYPGNKQATYTSVKTPEVTDIDPGVNKAILTLGNGSTVVLDSTSGKSLASEGGMNVVKVGDNRVEYQRSGIQQKGATVYNTITTPRGGQYHVALADGTNVWLNASSSVRFPVEFNDSTREIEMTGEAYFEVAHNPKKPFRVKVKDNYINVLGTHFNVMAYDNEPGINTTLLQGSVRIDNEKSSRVLAPGQQAMVGALGSIRIKKDADVEEAIAWKNGFFLFNSSDIRSIMHQVERWYDADVHYEGEVKLHFTGQVSRNVKVSELLRKLELTNEVHFKIEGKKITVLP
ncbi:MAG: FecR domain-containing protein [Chitinophagaceae bacterium]|nr:FecR domain-containing protein [Chitinophagaceae bacterium]